MNYIQLFRKQRTGKSITTDSWRFSLWSLCCSATLWSLCCSPALCSISCSALWTLCCSTTLWSLCCSAALGSLCCSTVLSLCCTNMISLCLWICGSKKTIASSGLRFVGVIMSFDDFVACFEYSRVMLQKTKESIPGWLLGFNYTL